MTQCKEGSCDGQGVQPMGVCVQGAVQLVYSEQGVQDVCSIHELRTTHPHQQQMSFHLLPPEQTKVSRFRLPFAAQKCF